MSLISSMISERTSATHTISKHRLCMGGLEPHYRPPHAHALATQSPSSLGLHPKTQNAIIRPLFITIACQKHFFSCTRDLLCQFLRGHAALQRPLCVCIGPIQKAPKITVKNEIFWKASINNGNRLSLRHTWL